MSAPVLSLPPAVDAGTLRVATWNVNSLRVRLAHVLEWLGTQPVDVLALQEIKLVAEKFPYDAFAERGYHCAVNGQPTYNGVALVARAPLLDVRCDVAAFEDTQKRLIAATCRGVRVVSVYCPNGQAVGSEKYQYKLRWFDAVRADVAQMLTVHPDLVLTGDFNVAPADADVHDPAAWAGQVLCSEPEREALCALLGLGLVDCFRLFEQPERSFSWWDYRQGAFRRDLGLRIDHVLASQGLGARCRRSFIDVAPRRLEQPSDHAPVVAEFTWGGP